MCEFIKCISLTLLLLLVSMPCIDFVQKTGLFHPNVELTEFTHGVFYYKMKQFPPPYLLYYNESDVFDCHKQDSEYCFVNTNKTELNLYEPTFQVNIVM